MNWIERKSWKGPTEISVCQTEIPHPQGDIAIRLMQQLAIATCVPDGEDAGGRQKFRLMTEEEVVDRSTKIADLTWVELRKRGWLLDIPLPQPQKASEETL